jgi:NADPH:quinone reductase-like Zn-dependent oxidoreductase
MLRRPRLHRRVHQRLSADRAARCGIEHGIEAFAQFTQLTTERLAELAELVDNGVLKVHVEKIFPLSQASAALLQLEKHPPNGEFVLKLV